MEQSKENIIKYHQRKRKKHKIKLAITAIVFAVIGAMMIGKYYELSEKNLVSYTENSEAKYTVNLIENEFYEEEYLEEGLDVISNLIKNIDTEFKYNLDLQEELEYKYSYKITSEIKVKEESKSNLLYETKQDLINKEEQELKSNKLEITEKVNIDYKEYSEQVKKLIEAYKLYNTKSELHINLYLNVINKATDEQINKTEKVATVAMPLATRTVEININENIKNEQGVIKSQPNQYENLEYVLVAGILILIISVIIFVKLIKYILDTRSAEKMYDDELKKIMFDYKSYIQKINNKIDYQDYKVIKIDTFKEMLGMREELQSPILMYTEDNRKTTFIMINEKLLFEYVLEAKLIREKLIAKSKEKANKKKK